MMTLFRLALVAALIGGTLSITACGFALRGSNHALFATPTSVKLTLPDDVGSLALKHALDQHLRLMGAQPDDAADKQIVVSNLSLRRYELVGTLTEVRLVLMADVGYHLSPKSVQNVSLQVERNYQYNEASVVALDQQGNKAQAWLYDDLAKHIAEQYRAILLP